MPIRGRDDLDTAFDDTRPARRRPGLDRSSVDRPSARFRSAFDEEDEGSEDESGDETFDTPLESLNAPVEISGVSTESPIDNRISTLAGRSSSPRLFVQGGNYPSVLGLQVHKLENGAWVSLGTIPPEATEEDFVKKFRNSMPRPGDDRAVFKLWPLGRDGKEIGHETEKTIGADHVVLQALRAREEEEDRQRQLRMLGVPGVPYGYPGYPPAPTGPQNVPDSILGLMQSTMDRTFQMTQAEQERSRLNASREVEIQAQNNAVTTNAIQTLAEKSMLAEQERARLALEQMRAQSQQLSDNTAAFFQQTLEASRQAADREVQSARIAAEKRLTVPGWIKS